MRWILMVTFGIGGLAVLVAGMQLGIERYQLYRTGFHARGKVVELVEHYLKGHDSSFSSHGTYTPSRSIYYPVVEFRTKGGEKVRFRGGEGSQDSRKYTNDLKLTPRALDADEQKALDDHYGTSDNSAEVIVGTSDGVKNSVFTITLGATVDVIYDSRNPSDAQIGTLNQVFLRPLIMTVLGFSFVAFAIRALFVDD